MYMIRIRFFSARELFPKPFRCARCALRRSLTLSISHLQPLKLCTGFLSMSICICRTANSCKADFIVGALRITCNGLCTAARFHSADENRGCFLGCSEGLDCLRHNSQCLTLLRSLLAIWLGTGECISQCISPTAIFNDLIVQNCRSK